MYRSEILDVYDTRNRDVMFEGASVSALHLYGDHEHRGLRFEIFHYNSSGPHVPIGFIQTSASAFKFARPGGKLFVVPAQGYCLKGGQVILKMAKMGLTTRRGDMNSVFSLQATEFTWRKHGESEENDTYLERDTYGRTRYEVPETEAGFMPRGVSYMSARRQKAATDEDDGDGDSDRDVTRKFECELSAFEKRS